MPAERWSVWDLCEAFHLAHAADFVVATELLDDEERPASVLAARAAIDPRLFGRLLEFLACRTDLVVRGPGGFRKGPGLGPLEQAVIDQYVGAYGPNAESLPTILSSPHRGRDMVNRALQALAFDRASGAGPALLPELLRKLGLRRILDLGCGTGGLLIEMGRDPDFRGYGLDANPAMIRVAQTRLRASGAGEGRVHFCIGDATNPAAALSSEVLNELTAVVAASMLNELFHPDEKPAIRCLQAIGEALPGRLLIVVDYYGCLGHVAEPAPWRALHDWIQLISSQGIPPPDLGGWESIYREADCTLLHAIEDCGLGTFVHIIRLAQRDTA